MADEDDASEVANVCVAVRCRPMSSKELGEGQKPIVEFAAGGQKVALRDGKGEDHEYQFDNVFNLTSTQESVFLALGNPLLDKAFDGYNGTIFAYGQTGSGKTHTMMNIHSTEEEDRGLIPRINQGLFDRIKIATAESETRRFLVCCSFLEIYNEIIYDLLVPRGKNAKGGGLEIREQKGLGVYVKDLTEVTVVDTEKLNQMIVQGFEHRTTAATKMNEGSSRSHCIFIIKLHQKDASDETRNTFSKINLVDLAGSERAKSTEAEGERLKEGANINKSLSALGNVINALSTASTSSKKTFIPYRNSKLTRVLQESLGGNSLCTMIAAMSPASLNSEETLSTLNYARRAKSIKVTATKNEESGQVKKLEDEVAALKAKLEQQALSGVSASMNSKEKAEMESKYVDQIEELQAFMKQSWDDKENISKRYAEEQERIRQLEADAVEKAKKDRIRRLKVLEDKADVSLTLASLESTLCNDLPAMVSEALKAEQHVKSQLHSVRLFRDSAGSDFAMWWSKRSGDDSVQYTLLGQVHTKLGAMRKELDSLTRLQEQFEEKMGQIGPKVGLALHEVQSREDAGAEEEELLSMVQRQLQAHHTKARASMREERQQLGFKEELGWLSEGLDGDSSSPSNSRQTLRLSIQAEAAASQQNIEEGEAEVPAMLGLSNLEWPDDRMTASSNSDAACCARLLQSVTFGGWCPLVDSESEYLQVDLGEERRVAALSLQGRCSCSTNWSQTRDLLRQVLGGVDVALPSGDKLPSAEKFYKRPPVRLIHDIGIALAYDKKCFAETWEVPPEYHTYGDLTRDQKVGFFDELLKCSNQACPGLKLSLTTQDILSGKNCEESNRLLQLLACISLGTGSGLDDASPQWTRSFKLELFTEASGWRWCGSPDGAGADQASVFDGNSDATTVKYVVLPQDLIASQLRVHPSTWERHASLRCEVHVASKGAVLMSARGSSGKAAGSSSLEDCVALVRSGVHEMQKGIQERQSAKIAEEEGQKAAVLSQKDKAEQERDDLEKRLKDALERLSILEEQHADVSEKYTATETSLLQLTVERDRLSADNKQLDSDLQVAGGGKSVAEEQIATLREEGAELQEKVEDLGSQLEVMTEERDLARAKEEELFDEKLRMEEEIMDTNNGYVWVTERLQEKEEEMENLEDQVRKGQEGSDHLGDRCSELQDELMKLRVEHQTLHGKLAEEVRMHKAAQDRYVRVLKDRTLEGAVGRPETASTSPSTQEQGVTKTPEKAPPAAAEDAYEDDFDDEGD